MGNGLLSSFAKNRNRNYQDANESQGNRELIFVGDQNPELVLSLFK